MMLELPLLLYNRIQENLKEKPQLTSISKELASLCILEENINKIVENVYNDF